MTDIFRYTVNVEKAYLEMARAFTGCQISHPGIGDRAGEVTPTHNTVFAFVSLGYIYSYSAVVAFATAQLSLLWADPGGTLRKQYSQRKSLDDLLRNELRETKEVIRALCRHKGIPQIQDAQPALWNQFLQVVQTARHFFIHPSPDSARLSKVVDLTHDKRPWGYPAKVAEDIIAYLIEGMGAEVPPWVRQNQEFRIRHVEALAVAERQ